MRRLDRILQRWRARVAQPWVPDGARVLDIGCHRGEFLAALGSRIGPSVGLDPLAVPGRAPGHELRAEAFRAPLPFPAGSFDAVVLLATLEHIRRKGPLVRECARLLRPDGRVVLTVPSPWVDRIVPVLAACRLADGMSLEEHHGFMPGHAPRLFADAALDLEHHRRFQLGLNHLYVFRKPRLPR